MVGIDTNILVRFFMRDDELQSARAAVLIESLSAEQQGFISFVAVTFDRKASRLPGMRLLS